MTNQEIRDKAPSGATHYKTLKSFTGRVKYLYYEVDELKIKEFVHSGIIVVRSVKHVDVNKLTPL